MKISVILLTALIAVSVERSEPAGPLKPEDPIDLSSASYVIVDTETSEIVEANWERLDQPIPAGSLVKPFTALAYAARHFFRYPEVRCRGAEDECWLPRGHGTLGVESALAQSCNTYFLWLAGRVLWADIETVARRFGLAAPPMDAPVSAYIGLGTEWKLQPLALLRAYQELVRGSGDKPTTLCEWTSSRLPVVLGRMAGTSVLTRSGVSTPAVS